MDAKTAVLILPPGYRVGQKISALIEELRALGLEVRVRTESGPARETR